MSFSSRTPVAFDGREWSRPTYAFLKEFIAAGRSRQAADERRAGREPTERHITGGSYFAMDRGDRCAVRLHNTDVYTVWPDGRMMVDAGGWENSVMTRKFIERLSGVSIEQVPYNKRSKVGSDSQWWYRIHRAPAHWVSGGAAATQLSPWQGELEIMPDDSIGGEEGRVTLVRVDPELRKKALARKREVVAMARVMAPLHTPNTEAYNPRGAGREGYWELAEKNAADLVLYQLDAINDGGSDAESLVVRVSTRLFGEKNEYLYRAYEVHYDVSVSAEEARAELGL